VLTTYGKKKKHLVAKFYTGRQNLTDFLERPRKRKMDTKFGTWSVRSLCRADSLKTIANE
jgi:hypothetical protein